MVVAVLTGGANDCHAPSQSPGVMALQGKGRRTARARMACGMVVNVRWPFRSGGEVEGGEGAATIILSQC
jgi:hypothetical protein